MENATAVLMFENHQMFTAILQLCQESEFDVLDAIFFGLDCIYFYIEGEALYTLNYVYSHFNNLPYAIIF